METPRENNVCQRMCACRTKGTRAALLPHDQKVGQEKEPALKKKKKILYKYIMVQEKVERRWATERNRRDERDEEDGGGKKAVNI